MPEEEPSELRRLKWGETPWDSSSREELLREVQRLYAALGSAKSEMSMSRLSVPDHPYWSDRGSGGRAIAKAVMALERSPAAQCDGEDVYRKFFRFAADLLFTPELGFGWWICDACGTMMGSPPEGAQRSRECYTPKCNKAPTRPITWDDLRPEAAEKGGG